MAVSDYTVEKKQLEEEVQHSDKSDNVNFNHKEELAEENVHEAAERGHAATDQ